MALVTTGDLLPGLLILLGGLLHNVFGHTNTILSFQTLTDQPVPQELLIKALLTTTDFVVILGPETGRVGCQDLIGQHDFIGFLINTELEFRVGNDNATRKGIGVCGLIQLYGEVGNSGRMFTKDGSGCCSTND